MSQTAHQAASAKELIQVVTFRLDHEEYAIEITKVKEVILPAGITRVPQLPDCIDGVINLRGNVIPVVDLRKRFAITCTEKGDHTRILIAKPGDRIVGFIVDAVSQVLKIRRSDVQAPPDTIAGIAKKYLSGIAKLGDDRMLILLDIDCVLNADELRQLV